MYYMHEVHTYQLIMEVVNSMSFSKCSSQELVLVIHQSCHK